MNLLHSLIDKNIMIILNILLLLALYAGKVNILISITIYCIWFISTFISFKKGYEQKIDEEIILYYRQKIDKNYNKIDEISNN